MPFLESQLKLCFSRNPGDETYSIKAGPCCNAVCFIHWGSFRPRSLPGRAVGEAHRRYANFINARGRWTGHLFQSRFASVAMDESHLISAVCYVSLNPVRARLMTRAEDGPWSSVRAHINGADDGLVTVRPVLDRIPPELLSTTEDQDFGDLRLAEGRGDRLARQSLSPALNDCSADPSRAALQDADPR